MSARTPAEPRVRLPHNRPGLRRRINVDAKGTPLSPRAGGEHLSNLAARAGRWSTQHWKTAALLWLVLVVVAVAAGGVAGMQKLTDSEMATGETARAEQILATAGFKTPASEAVLVRSGTLTTADPAFRASVRTVMSSLRSMPQVTNLRSGGAGEISADRHAQLIQFDMKGKSETAYQRVAPVLDTISAVQRSHAGFTIAEFGLASSTKELNDTMGKDFASAERLSVPITFLILLLAFGAFVAAGVPVLLAFSAVLASIGISELVSHLAHASDATNSIILLMGMAVGVDYSLFYLKRAREERTAGHRGHEGVVRAAATSGQAVLISGCTVLIAMAGMLFAGSKIFTSIAIGTMLVVAIALAGSLTVLPALLGRLGDRVEYGLRQVLAATLLQPLRRADVQPRRLLWLRDTPTIIRRLKGDRQESRVWAFVLRGSMRYPASAVLLSAGVLVVFALPVFSMHTKLPSFTDLPKSLAIVKTYDTIQASFPGSEDPAHVVVKGKNVSTPRFKAVYAEAKKRALATGVVREPIRLVVNPSHTVARIDFPLAGKGQDATATRALETLRADVIPSALASLPAGTEAAVTGPTAWTHDFNETMKQRAPYVFAFVLGLAFVLLLLTFRSIVVPIKAILLNLLSVGAAYGILVWIFQEGHLQSLLGFHSNGAIVAWLPLFLFTVLFGLSMDYHVFILSRIKELVDGGVPTDEAVSRGIRTTASTVTAAAAVMVAVFAIFASLQAIMIKQMGVGLAVAVLLDATVIRGVLLPAAMKLLGDWNWYLPRWLEWLPRLNVDEATRGRRAESRVLQPLEGAHPAPRLIRESVVLRNWIGVRPDAGGFRATHDEATKTRTEEDTMQKILIATDGSPAAREAVEFGIELAREHDAEAIFTHVIPAYDVVPTTLSFGVTGALPHEPCAADREPLEEAVSLAEEQGVPATSALLIGDPVDEIVAYADSIDADVLVLGSRGHGAIASALLGSVSRGVLHETRRRVLVVRGTEAGVEAPVASVS